MWAASRKGKGPWHENYGSKIWEAFVVGIQVWFLKNGQARSKRRGAWGVWKGVVRDYQLVHLGLQYYLILFW